MKLRLLISILLTGVVIVSACGQADEGLQGNAPEEATPNLTATVDIGMDVTSTQMISAAIEFSEWREAIVSGEPEPVLAVPGTPESIRLMGLNIGNWDPTCKRPMYLVILKGNFDGRNLFVNPSFATSDNEQGLRGRYVAYVFDLTSGVPGDVTFTILSEDRAAFKQALSDPTFPEPDFTVPEPVPPYPPCEDVSFLGKFGPEFQPTASPR